MLGGSLERPLAVPMRQADVASPRNWLGGSADGLIATPLIEKRSHARLAPWPSCSELRPPGVAFSEPAGARAHLEDARKQVQRCSLALQGRLCAVHHAAAVPTAPCRRPRLCRSAAAMDEPGPADCALLVTAHPDDEAMFWAPTILALLDQGLRVALLCLSTGASDAAAAAAAQRSAARRACMPGACTDVDELGA